MNIKRAGAALMVVSVSTACVSGLVSAASATNSTTTNQLPSDVNIMVRKTVLQTGNATGQLTDMSMFTQVSAVGDGSKTIEIPVGTPSVRNLNNFGSPATQGDDVIMPITVDGNTTQRIYTKADIQPVKVVARATLDGKVINPTEVINQTGVLKVTYEVTNTTARTIETTYRNGAGLDVTTTATLADPFVGSLNITLPSQFGEITARGATVAGDGKGGTQLGYQMVLFDPLGSPTQTLTYESRIQNGTLPDVKFGFLPIVPYDNSTISTTKDAYASGAASGEKIYGAGLELGDNLVKLQVGAGKLLAGLNTAVDGAQQLADGLNGKAIPGAKDLAAGSKKLNAGLSDKIAPGAQDIADGFVKVDQALRDLPATVMDDPKYQQLVGGVTQLQIGLHQLNINQGPVLQSFATQVTEYLDSIKALAVGAGCTSSACAEIVQDATSGLAANSNVKTGIEGIVEQAGTGADGLKQVNDGISQLVDSIASGLYDNSDWQKLVAGGQTLAEGTLEAADGAKQVADGSETLYEGLEPAGTGASALAGGLGAAVDGVAKIEDGAGKLKLEGTDKLMESGDAAASEFAAKVALLDALQVAGKAGAGIPYGNAVGANTSTTGAYQLLLNGASATTADNVARYTVGVLGFIVAGGVATMMWRRRAGL